MEQENNLTKTTDEINISNITTVEDLYNLIASFSTSLKIPKENIIISLNMLNDKKIYEILFLIIWYHKIKFEEKLIYKTLYKDKGFGLDGKNISDSLFLILQNFIYFFEKK